MEPRPGGPIHRRVHLAGASGPEGTRGGTRSYGRHINDAGIIAGYSYVEEDFASAAFVAMPESMGDLPNSHLVERSSSPKSSNPVG